MGSGVLNQYVGELCCYVTIMMFGLYIGSREQAQWLGMHGQFRLWLPCLILVVSKYLKMNVWHTSFYPTLYSVDTRPVWWEASILVLNPRGVWYHPYHLETIARAMWITWPRTICHMIWIQCMLISVHSWTSSFEKTLHSFISVTVVTIILVAEFINIDGSLYTY